MCIDVAALLLLRYRWMRRLKYDDRYDLMTTTRLQQLVFLCFSALDPDLSQPLFHCLFSHRFHSLALWTCRSGARGCTPFVTICRSRPLLFCFILTLSVHYQCYVSLKLYLPCLFLSCSPIYLVPCCPICLPTVPAR